MGVELRAGSTRIAVLHGGESREREVSLVSGQAALSALRARGHSAQAVDVTPGIVAWLARERPDVCLNMLHGKGGEDGCIQGLLEVLQLPYTHSGVAASALGMDKHRAKAVFREAGIPVASGRLVAAKDFRQGHPLPPPYVVKPNDEGSSIGVRRVFEGDAPPAAAAEEGCLLVERYVGGMELTVSVLGDRALEATRILSGRGWYDYAAKYSPGGSRHELPARLPPGVRERLLALALAAHQALGCRGVSRSDFRFDPDSGEMALLEINTQPGMTPTSLVPEQAAHVGISFPELLEWMLEDASCRR